MILVIYMDLSCACGSVLLRFLQESFDSCQVDAYHFAPMSESPLPNIIEPFKLAAKNVCLQGCVNLKTFPRLRADLQAESLSRQVDVELQFALSADGLAMVTGSLHAELGLQCQRCLGVVDVPIESMLNWVFAHDEAAALHVSASSELILLEESSISLFDLLEDELFLSLPCVPMHAEGKCDVPEAAETQPEQVQTKETVKISPFVVLADFKKKN